MEYSRFSSLRSIPTNIKLLHMYLYGKTTLTGPLIKPLLAPKAIRTPHPLADGVLTTAECEYIRPVRCWSQRDGYNTFPAIDVEGNTMKARSANLGTSVVPNKTE
jgi:hypothetical protein